MLSFFTDPYPEELLYSTFARYHFYSGNRDFKDTLEELFGKRSIVPTLQIGSNLTYLCDALGGVYTPEYLIQAHALFPYYAPFMSTLHQRKIIKKSKGNSGAGILTEMGVVAGGICRKDGIYYCPGCASEDIIKYGEPYLHRVHQLEGVWVCPHHNTTLKKYEIDFKERSRIEYIRLEADRLDFHEDLPEIHTEHFEWMCKISRAAYSLINKNYSQFNKDKIHQYYEAYLRRMGLITENHHIRQSIISRMLVDYYGIEFLREMESEVDSKNGYNWVQVVLRNETRMVHPIRHILLILFFAENIDAFFNNIGSFKSVFGDGPWPCLNPVSGHYRQAVVTNISVRYEGKMNKMVGVFNCECGYSYSRSATESNEFKKQRTLKYGGVWIQKLIEMLSNHESYSHMALKLQCDIKTIHNIEKQIKEVRFQRTLEELIMDETKYKIKIDECTNTILRNKEENKNATRTEIRKLCPREYIFLYRHNRELLLHILPEVRHYAKRREYVNWDLRDLELLEKLKVAKEKLLRIKWKSRLTRTALLREVEQLALCKKAIWKLPRCNAFFEKNSETVQQYHDRISQKIPMN